MAVRLNVVAIGYWSPPQAAKTKPTSRRVTWLHWRQRVKLRSKF